VARPIGTFKTSSDYHYQTLRCNVDLLKIIQLGLTFRMSMATSANTSTWQFNFRVQHYVASLHLFVLVLSPNDAYCFIQPFHNAAMICTPQIRLSCLTKSGINFKKHEIMVSMWNTLESYSSLGTRFVCDVKWISFHRYVKLQIHNRTRPCL